MNHKKSPSILLGLLGACLVSGCATLETVPMDDMPIMENYVTTPIPQGIYHKVNRGETVWRIAKSYDVTITEIIESNNIPDIAQIEVNQLILIPGATEVRPVFAEPEGVEESEGYIWPLKGKILTHFHKIRDGVKSRGIDIRASQGEVVRAARSGEVVFADYLPGQGYMIILEHPDEFFTVYSKNAQLLVSLGDRVGQSQPIAHVGQDDRLAYLHFQIRKRSKEDNPLYYLP